MVKNLFRGILILTFLVPSIVSAKELRVLKSELACDAEGILIKYYKFVSQGDQEAATKWAATAMSMGRCVKLKAGETVFFEGVCGPGRLPTSRYTVKVRRKGSAGGYCVNDEAVSSEWNPDLIQNK